MPGLRTLAVLTDLPTCVEQDEFRNSTELHAGGPNSRSGRLLELPFSNSAFTFLSMSPYCTLRSPAHCGVQLWGKACPEGCQDDGKSHSDRLNLSLWIP